MHLTDKELTTLAIIIYYALLVSSNHITVIGAFAYSLPVERKERYIYVLQQVSRYFLPCYLFSTCLYFTLRSRWDFSPQK